MLHRLLGLSIWQPCTPWVSGGCRANCPCDPGNIHRGAVEAEYGKNKALGERLGCWKGGVLVEDDAGSVRAALQQP